MVAGVVRGTVAGADSSAALTGNLQARALLPLPLLLFLRWLLMACRSGCPARRLLSERRRSVVGRGGLERLTGGLRRGQ